jgi:outer membrane protein assembly factor BamB
MLGGGLAVAGNQLFVTTGQGDVYALNVQDGSMIWKRGLAMPVRSAPKIQHGMVYIMTVDDQVFALDSATGNIAWKHRGISEQVSFLAAIAPAIGENYLVAAYSSGELYGLAADTGQELWNDSLAVARKTSASSIFTGFGGDPVVAGGVAFASSKSGLLAATHVFTGRRLWEQDIAAHGLPFLSGNFLFMLAENTQVLAVHARDGRIKWVTQLPRFDDPEEQEDPYHWHGPIGVNGLLLVVGEHGKMLALSPSDGSVMSTYKIPDGVKSAPVIANGVIYMVSANATLHVLN